MSLSDHSLASRLFQTLSGNNHDLFLKDYDKYMEQTIKDAWRDVDTISASINTLFKLELMKLPQEVKDMKWDDFYQQALDRGDNPLALSEAIAACVEDSISSTVDTQVSQIKSAMKNKGKRGRKKSVKADHDPPPSATRSSGRSRAPPKRLLAESATPANTRNSRNAKNQLITPAHSKAPPNNGETPMITPKFDTTRSIARTVTRVARTDEVLVSLQGSPVVGVTAKVMIQLPSVLISIFFFNQATKAASEHAVLVPLGKGETLCVPIGQDTTNMIDHLDQEQVERLDELQKSIANMIQSRREEAEKM